MPRVIRDIVSCCTEEGMIVKGFDRSLDPVRIASYLKPKRVKRATSFFYSLRYIKVLCIVVRLCKTSMDWMTIFEMTMSVDVGTLPSHVVMNMAFRNDTVPDESCLDNLKFYSSLVSNSSTDCVDHNSILS